MSVASRIDLRFDPPPMIVVAERRLSGRVLDAWTAGGGRAVAGFDDHALVIENPGGAARLESVGGAIIASFGLAAGMTLEGGRLASASLVAELRAACDLIAVDPRPVPIEATLVAPGRACVLVRGIALPIGDWGPETALAAPARVQAFVNWRTLLDRAATTRLRLALGAATRERGPGTALDPFALAPEVEARTARRGADR